MKDHKMVNGQNYFNDKSFNEMIELLESGETISIYIDCIGHTRNAIETAAYVNALQEKYGDRLIIDTTSSWQALYSLK